MEMALFQLLNQSLTDAKSQCKVFIVQGKLNLRFKNENIDGATNYLELGKNVF